ncbi:MAG: DUF6076 domain-containing protein [Lachnospiraceae bacterium]|jgi:hypothetical protein|nr:DUF6076 domain-containing protein [Lachnospiraceae bacterium]
MSYKGLTIRYENGTNTIVDLNVNRTYKAGELLCELLQGDSEEILRSWPRLFITHYNRIADDVDPYNIDLAISDVEHKISSIEEDMPLTVCMLKAIFCREIDRFRTVIDRNEQEVDALEAKMNNELYDNDVRQIFIPGTIHFDDMGGYLKACYFNYLADVLDGTLFFYAAAAKETNKMVEGQDEQYERVLTELETSDHIDGLQVKIQYDRDSKKFSTVYEIQSMRALLAFEFVHMQDCGTMIKQCQNPECGKYFVARRKNAIYCNYPSPQNYQRTCHEVYPQIKSEQKRKKDQLNDMFRKAQSRLLMNMKRHPESKDYYEEKKQKLVTGRFEKEQAIQNGEMSMKEYKNWLDQFR